MNYDADRIDAAGACADLIARGIPQGVAIEAVKRLAASDKLYRIGMVAGLFIAFAPIGSNVPYLANTITSWLRRYGYMPEPPRGVP